MNCLNKNILPSFLFQKWTHKTKVRGLTKFPSYWEELKNDAVSIILTIV